MERNCNNKKNKGNSQVSANSKQFTKSNNIYKYDKSNGSSRKVIEKRYESDNPSGNFKFTKHNSYSVHPTMYQESSFEYFAGYNDSDDLSDCPTPDFSKFVYGDQYKSKNLKSKATLKGEMMKEKIFSSVNQYKNSKVSFSKIYQRWLPERQRTLAKLRSLLEEIHDNTKNYYKTQATFKELSFNSRCVKQGTENQALNFFASFTAFVSDAASGITSFAQAFEIDSFQNKFKEIMDHDSEVTKDLYASRSRCISEYEGIEEIIRKFRPNTFTSTVGKISDTLHVDKHLAAIKNAYEKNDMSELLDEVCNFFGNACQIDVLENVGASVSRYVTDNPAALEACKSTGKAVFGAIDTFSEKKQGRNSAVGYVNKATNLYLMLEDKKEVDHLKSIIHEDAHQSKLELQIEEAISSLEEEVNEMKKIYFNLFNMYVSD